MASLIALAALGSAALMPAPRFVWNVSASAPVGLYAVDRTRALAVGDMVAARLGEPHRTFAAERHYLPRNVPIVKRVAAVAGDQVCARGRIVSVNDAATAHRQARDARGRALPSWHGCAVLASDQLLLIGTNPASFDGRYFGLTVQSEVIGRVTKIWPRP